MRGVRRGSALRRSLQTAEETTVREVQVRSRSFAFVMAAVLPAPLSLAGQNKSTPASASAARASLVSKSWTPPRTPDGQPDLQGMSTNATYTPLQRAEDPDTQAVCHHATMGPIQQRRR